MVHRNAPLSETGRLRLARCVVDDGWPPRRAGEPFQVSVTTASRWAYRYRDEGEAAMADRSSRPHHSPNRTPRRTERRIIGVRVTRRWGPARIAYLLRLNVSTVHNVLRRYGVAKLRWLDRATGRVVRRMESAACGDLVHVDVRKLGKIAAFWLRANAWFTECGFTVRKVLTDNGSCHRSHAFLDALGDVQHRRTRPDRPQNQRQGGALSPHPGRGMGLRPALHPRRRTLPGIHPLAAHLQSSPRPHRTRRSTTRHLRT